jgi:hypothetical protein
MKPSFLRMVSFLIRMKPPQPAPSRQEDPFLGRSLDNGSRLGGGKGAFLFA